MFVYREEVKKIRASFGYLGGELGKPFGIMGKIHGVSGGVYGEGNACYGVDQGDQ